MSQPAGHEPSGQPASDKHGPRAYRVRARVEVMPRQDILDPQGEAVGRVLAGLGFDEVAGVRIGKLITLDLGPAAEAAVGGAEGADPGRLAPYQARATQMARRLLANPVVEDFRVEVELVASSEDGV